MVHSWTDSISVMWTRRIHAAAFVFLCLQVGADNRTTSKDWKKKMRLAEDPDFVKKLGSGVLEDSLWRTGWMGLFFNFYPSAHTTCKRASHTRPGTERPWRAQQLSAIGPPNPFKDKQSCNEMELQLQRLLLQDWHYREIGVRAWPPGASCSYSAKQNAKIVV